MDYRVVIPVLTAPEVGRDPPAEWVSADKLADLITTIQGHRTDVRQNGGFVLQVRARDHFVAVERARELVDRWDARAEPRPLHLLSALAWTELFMRGSRKAHHRWCWLRVQPWASNSLVRQAVVIQLSYWNPEAGEWLTGSSA